MFSIPPWSYTWVKSHVNVVCFTMFTSTNITVGKVDSNEEKFGNINERLANHRCMDPSLIINYIIYTPQYDLLEKCILQRFEHKLIDLNHEFVDDLSIEEIYDGIKCIITSCGIQSTFEEQSEIDKYNEKIE